MDTIIGWAACEVIGCEIRSISGNILTQENELAIGCKVKIWVDLLCEVVARDGRIYLDSGDSIWIVEYKKDYRQCWVATGGINKKLLDNGTKV